MASRSKINDLYLPTDMAAGLAQAQATAERDFGWSTLSLRYGVPAVLIALTIGLFADPVYCLTPPDWLWAPAFLRGVRYGGAGAYVYVLLYLSRRNFRHDITSGAALWSAIDLAVGPVLGGITALLWRASDSEPAGFASAVLFFAAGLSPRHVASAMEEGARRLLRSPDDKSAVPPARTKPITLLRGVTTSIAERLEESGIEDLYGMAMADPVRLMRNTPFDQRQIASWIDEAILITTLPEHWAKLEDKGFTGAIDLAAQYEVDQRATGDDAAQPPLAFQKLAEVIGIDSAVLWGAAYRLFWDGQVQLLWVLYQMGSEAVQCNGESERAPPDQS